MVDKVLEWLLLLSLVGEAVTGRMVRLWVPLNLGTKNDQNPGTFEGNCQMYR